MDAGITATENFSKAIALVTLGVPMVTTEGKIAGPGDCPEWREISVEDLAKHGWKTIEDAEEAGFAGTITYGFANHPDKKRIAKAFDTAHHAPRNKVDLPDVIDLRTAKGREQAIEFAATIIAVAFRNRKYLADRRTKVTARLRMKKGSGFAIIDRRTPKETRDQLSQ